MYRRRGCAKNVELTIGIYIVPKNLEYKLWQGFKIIYSHIGILIGLTIRVEIFLRTILKYRGCRYDSITVAQIDGGLIPIYYNRKIRFRGVWRF